MKTLFCKDALQTLNLSLTTIKPGHHPNCTFANMVPRLICFKTVNTAYPCVTYTNFSLDSCRLEGEEIGFLLHRPNVFTVRTPILLANADGWSAYILHGMGEIMSIRCVNFGIQITYKVLSAFPVPKIIHVSISYQDMSIFPEPLEIRPASFKNMGRFAFSTSTSLFELNPLSEYSRLEDVLPDGSAVALFDEYMQAFTNRKNILVCVKKLRLSGRLLSSRHCIIPSV